MLFQNIKSHLMFSPLHKEQHPTASHPSFPEEDKGWVGAPAVAGAGMVKGVKRARL